MARIDTLGHFLTDVADAIRSKTGSSNKIIASDFDTEIRNIPSGGSGEITGDDVIFYDFDGTRLHSYSKADFLNLTEMPANPTHSGLISQGWNWSLSNAKTYVDDYGKLNIGQMYNTDDGKTRIYVCLQDGRLSPYLGFAINGTATIDWGDGSSTDTVTGTSASSVRNTRHTYDKAGDYMITIYSETEIYFRGTSTGSYLFHANNPAAFSEDRAYQNAVKKIEFSDNTNINSSNVFKYLYSLSSITIPSGVNSIGSNAFESCYSLLSIVIPSSINSIPTNCFNTCYSLLSIALPSSVSSIGSSAFNNCYSLLNITIPSGVIAIGNNMFSGCQSLSSITIPSSVGTIGSSAFSNCNSLSNVIIPDSVTSIGYSGFSGCLSLSSITIPSSVSSIASSAFNNCYSLSNITIPSGVTIIEASTFYYCQCLSSITIPNSVTSIADNAFNLAYSMSYYDFSNHTTIPELKSVNAFGYNPSDYKIVVPDDLYEDWIIATNWSNTSIVSHIIKKSDWDNL